MIVTKSKNKTWNHDFLIEKQLCSYTILYTYSGNIKHELCSAKCVPLLEFSIFFTSSASSAAKNNDPIVYLHLHFKSEKFLGWLGYMCLSVHADTVCVFPRCTLLLAYIIA